jgi:type IV pilus biogenesis protein CpaD/CtpE
MCESKGAAMKLLIAIVSLLLVSACASTPPETEVQIQTFTKNVLIKPSYEQTKDCIVSAKPDDRVVFLAKTKDDQLISLRDFATNLMTDLKVCSGRWSDLRQWLADQESNLNK